MKDTKSAALTFVAILGGTLFGLPAKADQIAVPAQAPASQGKSALSFLKLAYTDFIAKNFDSSIANFNRVLELEPLSVEALIGRAGAFYQKDDYDHALADLDQAIKLSPDNVLAIQTRGHLYISKGLPDKAIIDFNRVIELEPKRVSIYTSRGLGSGLIDHSQKITVAAMAIAEKKVWAQRS